ncbi:MAG TPA: cytochrome c-type biogenesis protein [Anaerolineales bacterium]|nr:cytochrome c-type biogenesis protein [Anaerolineales bacterium]
MHRPMISNRGSQSHLWFWPIACLMVLGVLLAFQPSLSVRAQDPTPTDDEVNRIARQLYCPVCENTPLDVCPTEACRQWRDLIRQKLSEGWTESQIQQYFVQQYGARVLAEPPRTGLNWMVYVLPPLIILAGVVMLFRSFRSWRTSSDESTAQAAGDQAAPPADEYVQRLEEELRKRG